MVEATLVNYIITINKSLFPQLVNHKPISSVKLLDARFSEKQQSLNINKHILSLHQIGGRHDYQWKKMM